MEFVKQNCYTESVRNLHLSVQAHEGEVIKQTAMTCPRLKRPKLLGI